jgi:hypothetical protein
VLKARQMVGSSAEIEHEPQLPRRDGW